MSSPGSDVWDWLASHAGARDRAGLRRSLRSRGPDDTVIDLASNDYLSLSGDPRVIDAAAAAAAKWGSGAGASRLVTGTLDLHGELEGALAEFTGHDAALVFSSGYLANIGAVTALSDADTLVLSDAQNHASLIDGCRLSRARVQVYPHGDVAAVEDALATRSESRALVVTDAVFGVDGRIAPLTELHAVAQRYGAALLVDEAHGLGVIGDRGAGVTAAAGLAGCRDVVLTVTLSKSLAAQGGAVIGAAPVIDHLIDAARTMMFDTALAPASAGAALAALQVLEAEPQRAERVRSRARELHSLAIAAGWFSVEPQSALATLQIPEAHTAVALQRRFAERGVAVGCFRPPSVPDGVSRIRMTAKAGLTDAHVRHVGQVLQELFAETAGESRT